MTLLGRIAGGLVAGTSNLDGAHSRAQILVEVSTRQPNAEQLADALLESLKLSKADRAAYQQANNGLDIRDQLIAEFREQGINHSTLEYAGNGKYRAYVGMPKETHQELVKWSKTDTHAPPETTGAGHAKQQELRAQGAHTRHQLELQLRKTEAKQQIVDSVVGQGGTQIAGQAIARELPKEIPKLGPAAIGATLALPALVTVNEIVDMAIERQVELNIAREAPTSPPPSQEMPPLPLLPPTADAADKLKSNPPPTMAAPPEMATSTPPMSTSQPLPSTPPMITPDQTERLRALITNLNMMAGLHGIGTWAATNETMSERAAAYQEQITGQPAGVVYVVNGVKFDGYENGALLDAKGPGYANFVKDGVFQSWWLKQGGQALLDEAQRQVAAANGTPIVWHVAEEAAVSAINQFLQENNYDQIRVTHTPVK